MSTPQAPTTVRRFALNAASHFGMYVLNTVLAIVVSVVVVRHLGPAEYGIMAFVVSYLSFFQILTSLGIDTVILREASRKPEASSDLVGRALSLRLALSAATMIAAWAIIPFVADSSRVSLLVVLYSATLLFSFHELYLVGFAVELRSYVPNRVLGMWSVAWTLIRLGLVALGARVVHFLAAEVVAAAITLWIKRTLGLRSSVRPRFRMDVALWKLLLRESWPIALASWLIAAHARVDQMLLFRLSGPTELGGYAVAVRISEIWGVATNVLVASIFPLLARDALDATDRMERTSALGYRYLFILICPVAVALGLYPRFILNVLFGARFLEAAPALALLGVAEVALFANAFTYNVLFSMGRQAEAALMAGLSLAANVLLNLWLIPAAGGRGAALAALTSYSLVAFLGLVIPGARRVAVTSFRALARPAAAAAAVALLLYGLRLEAIPAFAALGPAYLTALLMFGAVTKADLQLLKRARSGQ